MHIKTILNTLQPFKGFVYEGSEFDRNHGRLRVIVRPRKNSKGKCSGCGVRCPGYDRLPERQFEFIPILGQQVFLCYRPRRVSCPVCGIRVESVPWSQGKQRKCLAFLSFLASWAEDLPWKRVAERFQTSWQTVCLAVEWVVEYGLQHRNLEGVATIGIDEVKYKKGHKYLTVVYQLCEGSRRLLWVGKERKKKTLRQFFVDMEGYLPGFCISIRFVCIDMWKAYLTVVRNTIPQALHVLDRFHIRKKFSDALDTVRRDEVHRLKEEGYEPALTNSRWCILKKRKNLTGSQRTRLRDLLTMNLRTVRAFLLTEQFDHFWSYESVTWAKKFMTNWTRQAMYSKIEPMKNVARMLRKHEELILNWFRARKEINNGITEGLNLNIKLAMRKARGFRTFRIAEIALYHQLGKLPKPKLGAKLW